MELLLWTRCSVGVSACRVGAERARSQKHRRTTTGRKRSRRVAIGAEGTYKTNWSCLGAVVEMSECCAGGQYGGLVGSGDGEMTARAREAVANEAQKWAEGSECRGEMREKRVKKGALWLRRAGGREDAVRQATHLAGDVLSGIVWAARSSVCRWEDSMRELAGAARFW
ncbi:hypothetical protein B0J12DRAFT_153462 [Macrophomina phaseolina]|uniref:Uncharacterized protein n=1 Tax=Macrophomina phaseolina TaxID=35725 RepID=A0ABQ8G849_9PEZI|nr:hypothetical protein B0J12DRAFT_153462 [Macrophomina phaseolina]